ncbi:MAG: hypothetical protein Q8L41_04630 [Anaerolineales bacterium]|nr:hypothetical protein [Anaerolineales bacterium]
MSHECHLIITINDTGENVSLHGGFQEDAWNSLNEFLEYADDLLNTEFVKDGMRATLKIKWEQNSSMMVSTQLSDWDAVTVFLHKLRPIWLQDESTNFYKICNLLTKELTHPCFRNTVDEQRDIYSGKRKQATYTIQSNDVVLNSEKVLANWLNSFEYHRDKEKREFIEKLHKIFPLEASKVLFLGLLSDKALAINNIAVIARAIVGK